MATAVETTLCLFLFSMLTVSAVGETEKETLYFLSLLPYPNPVESLQPDYADGPSLASAAYLAVDQINNRSDILADYRIELIEGHGGCQHTSVTIISFLDKVLHSDRNVVGIVGPTCSLSTKALASLTRRKNISLLNVYIDCTFVPDNSEYPYVFGTSPADIHDAYDRSFLELIKRNQWTKFGIFNEGQRAAPFMEFISNYSFEIDFFVDITDNLIPIEEAEKSHARLILSFTSPGISPQLACLAYHHNITYPTYQWLFRENYSLPYVEVTHRNVIYGCTEKEMNLENSILFDTRLTPDDPQSPTVSGQTYYEYLQSFNEYMKEYNERTGGNDSFVVWANPIYDGTWALALALNKSIPELKERNLNLSEYRFGHNEITSVIGQKMFEVEFPGVSGFVEFKKRQNFVDRSLSYDIFQSVNGEFKHIGTFNSTSFIGLEDAIFIDDKFETVEVHANIIVVFIFSNFAAVALLLTIGAHAINTICRNQRSVKASSPRINHFAYAGCYLLIAAIVVESVIKSATLGDSAKEVLCNAIPWLYNIGLTLILATVCAKTWRLYTVFALTLNVSRSLWFLKCTFLSAIVLFLSLVTVLVCVVWITVDPLTIKAKQTVLYNDHNTPTSIEVEEYCDSNWSVYWSGSLLGYELLLMVFSVMFALVTQTHHGMEEFKTRNVAILAYLLALTMGLCVPIYWITHRLLLDINIQYTALCLWLVMVVYLCIAFLFLPPILPVVKSHGRDNPVPKRTTGRPMQRSGVTHYSYNTETGTAM